MTQETTTPSSGTPSSPKRGTLRRYVSPGELVLVEGQNILGVKEGTIAMYLGISFPHNPDLRKIFIVVPKKGEMWVRDEYCLRAITLTEAEEQLVLTRLEALTTSQIFPNHLDTFNKVLQTELEYEDLID